MHEVMLHPVPVCNKGSHFLSPSVDLLGAHRQSRGAEPTLGVPDPDPDQGRGHLTATELPPPTDLLRPGRQQQDTFGHCLG